MQKQWKVIYLPLLRLSPNANASGKAVLEPPESGIPGRANAMSTGVLPLFGARQLRHIVGGALCFLSVKTTLTYTHVTTRRITEIESPLDDLGLKPEWRYRFVAGIRELAVMKKRIKYF